ncbi:transcription factor bHLH100-like [Magnolia sinica]|uniref:transcription factor bHLH100-like n=1 Tax=Magnolia sinica TaxID=86752 RepID=UPI00265B140B|nr:transcription factor bHLH100-like [Magnolia sinica]
MLALSFPQFSTFELPLDDQMVDNHMNWDGPFMNCMNQETGTSESYIQFATCMPEISIEDPKQSSVSGVDPSNVKKLSHNANERDRRKKLNNLYSSLRTMLPGLHPKKKLSIPATVSYVLKYIPELQKQVEGLKKRKEEILSKITKQGDLSYLRNIRSEAASVLPSQTISVRECGDKEVMIQICSVNSDNERRCPLSMVVQSLEDEGLLVLNSSFTIAGGKVFHNLHLQAQRNENLFRLTGIISLGGAAVYVANSTSACMWHACLGDMSERGMKGVLDLCILMYGGHRL